MSTRIVLFALAIIVVSIFMVEKTVKRPADSALADNAPQPLAAADLDSMRRLAVATPTPAEIAAVAAAFRSYMALENTSRLAELYADNAHIWLHRKQTEDDPDPRQESYSGSALKAYLNGSGPAPMTEEEPVALSALAARPSRLDDGVLGAKRGAGHPQLPPRRLGNARLLRASVRPHARRDPLSSR